MTDWKAIQSEYEQGASLRSLATKYGVGKSTIGERKFQEHWEQKPASDTGHRTPDTLPLPRPTPLPIPADARAIARIGLSQLARHLETDTLLPITYHKSISDALAQYVKVLTTAPAEIEVQEGLVLPLEKLLPETRRAIRQLLAEDEQVQFQRKLEERTG